MKLPAALLVSLPLILSSPTHAHQSESYDYWEFARELIRYGQQAIFVERYAPGVDIYTRTRTWSAAKSGNFYGGQFSLVPDERTDVPRSAYSTSGNRGQYVIIEPAHDLVIVRRGLDYGRQGFNRWDLAHEVLKAFPSGG